MGELLFGLRKKVGRRDYLIVGFALAALKFMIDTSIVYSFTGKVWSPLGYIVPSVALRQDAVGPGPGAMHILLVMAALPFLWIGLSMSVRRAADAGKSPWIGTLFVLPLVNYAVIALLSIVPSAEKAAWQSPRQDPYRPSPNLAPESRASLPPSLRAAMLGVLVSASLGITMTMITVYGFGAYGAALFFATPLAMGASSAAVYNRNGLRSLGATISVAVSGTAVVGAICLLFAIEGVICLLMAFPIAAVLSVVGAAVGRAIVANSKSSAPYAMLLVLPAFAIGEARLATPQLHHVTTSIEIDAPPEVVWPNVIGFRDIDLPAPPAWFFRLGIAYPLRARIQGTGVGAVRHCEFSTGPFVEPITVWDPPRRLAFDVTSQPPSMTEWSPYQSLKAPHLEGYMVSKGGEFLLTGLPNGRTRLEGTTHYTLAIYPEAYWVVFAEPLLHAIHARVLTHIKGLSQSPGPG